MITYLVAAIILGVGATLAIDLWSLFLKRAFGIPSLSYCMLGRWFLHMPGGTFMHARIGEAQPKASECVVGWIAHYGIGIFLSLVFLALAGRGWLAHPSLAPALGFGVVTTLIPFLVLQPSIGLGIASAKAPNPTRARLKSLSTHSVFGLGLYLSALLLAPRLSP
ncbi:MAG TPA: DUF2938 domain-containing protein [Gemmatimonadales bacterium]|nr:DUF2938 domain-containing protein [Gemmatimonadales bacterium]